MDDYFFGDVDDINDVPNVDVPIIPTSVYVNNGRFKSGYLYRNRTVHRNKAWSVMFGSRIVMQGECDSGYAYFYRIAKRYMKKHKYKPRRITLNHPPVNGVYSLATLISDAISTRDSAYRSSWQRRGWEEDKVRERLQYRIDRKFFKYERKHVMVLFYEGKITYETEISKAKWRTLCALVDAVSTTETYPISWMRDYEYKKLHGLRAFRSGERMRFDAVHKALRRRWDDQFRDTPGELSWEERRLLNQIRG